MAYVSSIELLNAAKVGKYAVGAFNIENMEMAQVVIETAERLNSPVIIQTTPSTVRYGSLELYYANVFALANKVKIPVALHLDHGSGFDLAKSAIAAGYSSVMYDGSELTFEQNVEATAEVVRFAIKSGVSTEAELGKVGGKEDDTESDGQAYTDPDEAAEFVAKTGVQSLAIGIGTAHGIYALKPILDIARVREIAAKVSVPLVLHGASGVEYDDILACIKNGICKVNFATELRIAFTDGVKQALIENPNVFDPKVLGNAAKANVREAVSAKIEMCGCAGKA